MAKFKRGDKVAFYGLEGVVRGTDKKGGWLIETNNGGKTNAQFVYESELTLLSNLEDDRGKNRMLDDPK